MRKPGGPSPVDDRRCGDAMRPRSRRAPGAALAAGMLAITLAAALAACGAREPCAGIALSPEAARQLRAIERDSAFAVVRPCAYGRDLQVSRVFVDVLPEDGRRYPRVHFAVRREGARAFVLSQTEARVPFLAIPLGSHRLRAEADGLVAEGFAGPAGTGDDIAYLRWRRGGVTFELAAPLGPWLTERDARDLARGMMSR